MTGPGHPPAGDLWRRVARGVGDDYADRYADRFEAMAARGEDIHGEADFVHGLLRPGSRVLDAGCGTGRVGLRLGDLGHELTGVDADETMIDVAVRRSPGPRWVVADLAELELGEVFDAVVLAGNVVPFLDGGRLGRAMRRIALHTVADGLVVCGYGLDQQHVPPGSLLVPLEEYDDACTAAGLGLVSRHAGWDGAPYSGGGYAVSVHRAVPDSLAGTGDAG